MARRMKRSDRNLLLLAGGGGLAAWWFLDQKKKKEAAGVAGYPGVGATMPDWGLIPETMRGKASPLPLDIALWGGLGTALGYFGLAGKRL